MEFLCDYDISEAAPVALHVDKHSYEKLKETIVSLELIMAYWTPPL